MFICSAFLLRDFITFIPCLRTVFSGNDYMWHSAGKKHGSTEIFTFSGMVSLRPCVAKDFIEICFLRILKNIAVCSFSLYKVVIKTSLMVLLAAFVCMWGLCFVSKNIFSQEMIANYCVHTPGTLLCFGIGANLESLGNTYIIFTLLPCEFHFLLLLFCILRFAIFLVP